MESEGKQPEKVEGRNSTFEKVCEDLPSEAFASGDYFDEMLDEILDEIYEEEVEEQLSHLGWMYGAEVVS